MIDKTKLMGILNVTPDSFYEKSRFSSLETAILKAHEMVKDGVDIIDIGGESTRPKNVYSPSNEIVTVDVELKRVLPVIKELKKNITIPLSIDTMKYQVAEAAVNAGIDWINDVRGFRDFEMRKVAAQNPHIKICVMHMQGTPETMQENPAYTGSVTENIKHWFLDTLENLLKVGVQNKQIIIDPGIGFGKTVAHNVEIIQNLREIKSWGFPVLLGISRKKFMSKLLQDKPTNDLLAATLAVDSLAVLSRIDYIRVHDVKEHRDLIDVLTPLLKK